MTQSPQPRAIEFDIAYRKAPLIEEALMCQVGAMQPMDLLLIEKDLLNDMEFFHLCQAVREELYAAHPEWNGSQRSLCEMKYDVALTAARRMTKQEKLALRARVMRCSGAKLV
jgi:hypothetical protein